MRVATDRLGHFCGGESFLSIKTLFPNLSFKRKKEEATRNRTYSVDSCANKKEQKKEKRREEKKEKNFNLSTKCPKVFSLPFFSASFPISSFTTHAPREPVFRGITYD